MRISVEITNELFIIYLGSAGVHEAIIQSYYGNPTKTTTIVLMILLHPRLRTRIKNCFY